MVVLHTIVSAECNNLTVGAELPLERLVRHIFISPGIKR